MLLLGDYTIIPYLKDLNKNILIYNLSSFIEGYPKLNLQPPTNVYCADEFTFDMNYANHLIQNDYAFSQLMELMMYIYSGNSIYIIYQRNDEYNEMIAESLMKFIQQRYGYNYYIINDFEDLDFIISSNIGNNNFTINGIYNFDMDKARFIEMQIKGYEAHGIKFIPEGQLW